MINKSANSNFNSNPDINCDTNSDFNSVLNSDLNSVLSSKFIRFKKSVGFSFTFLLMALLLQACGSDKKLLNRISESGTILAFGDSLTSGVGVSPANSYPSVLTQISGRKVVNAGISGEVTKQGLARLAKVIDKTNPELLILLQGGNDILRNHNLVETKQNLSAMISLAKAEGVQVVLIGVPTKKLFSDAAPFYLELAEEHNVAFLPDLISTLLYKPKFKSDRVHFNKKGYSKMAAEIHEFLQDNGAL